MPRLKETQFEEVATQMPREVGMHNGDVRVVVVMDGVTRSSIATIRKDMSSAVKRDINILKRFGLVSGSR